jgi:aspartate/methionine/tyrosine aminotransferase
MARALREQGKDVITLSVGEPDTPVAPEIVAAATKAMLEGKTRYTANNGVLELRQEIVRKLKRENGLEYSAEQVVVSNGAKQSLVQAIMALSCPGDEVPADPSPLTHTHTHTYARTLCR